MRKLKSKKYHKFRTAKLLRKRKQSVLKKKERNVLRNKPNSDRYDSSRPIKNKYTNRIDKQEISVGETFSLLKDPFNVLKLINTIEKRKIKNKHITNIHLELSHIKEIDIGAISILLSKVNQVSLGSKRIKFSGTFPIDGTCREFFNKSGFLDYMADISGNKFNKQSDNYLVRIGRDKTDNEKVGVHIKKAMKFITGSEVHYPPVFSVIQEMCSNSVEHSNKIGKNWLLGVNYSDAEDELEKRVTFTMTDMGFGILKTLKRKFATRIKETMANDPEILQRAFEKKYDSATKEVNRNKGLPLILDRTEKKYIKGLKVITNNVFLDLENPSLSKTLDLNLGGTFYCWEINLNCIELWNKASIN